MYYIIILSDFYVVVYLYLNLFFVVVLIVVVIIFNYIKFIVLIIFCGFFVINIGLYKNSNELNWLKKN